MEMWRHVLINLLTEEDEIEITVTVNCDCEGWFDSFDNPLRD